MARRISTEALPAPHVRHLTRAERALAASVFGPALDAAPVTVRRERWWLLHPCRVIMAPDGHLWCHPGGGTWRACFATDPDPWVRAHFVHELVHVWQHQTGRLRWWRYPPGARYRYRLVPGRRFGAYGLEQQAEMVRHAFLLRAGVRLANAAPYAALARLIPFWPRHRDHPG
jgi:hypothetical protein